MTTSRHHKKSSLQQRSGSAQSRPHVQTKFKRCKLLSLAMSAMSLCFHSAVAAVLDSIFAGWLLTQIGSIRTLTARADLLSLVLAIPCHDSRAQCHHCRDAITAEVQARPKPQARRCPTEKVFRCRRLPHRTCHSDVARLHRLTSPMTIPLLVYPTVRLSSLIRGWRCRRTLRQQSMQWIPER